jgi:hypothetical protein
MIRFTLLSFNTLPHTGPLSVPIDQESGWVPDAICVDNIRDFFFVCLETSRRPDLSPKNKSRADGLIAVFLFPPDRPFIRFLQFTVSYFI